MSAASEPLAVDHFDGVSARARRVHVTVVGSTLLLSDPEAGQRDSLQLPLADVQWPERTRHGPRVAHFRLGGSVQALDVHAWDAWLRSAGIAESAVVRAQQSWRLTAVAVLLLLILAATGYRWGVPWLTHGVVAALPLSADRAIDEAVLNALDGTLLLPSKVTAARQQELREAVARAEARHPHPIAHQLLFRSSAKLGNGADARTRLGANALALPGGTVIVTDEMLALLQGRDDVLLGVVGHELGHVRQRHGMRMLIQASLIGLAAQIAWGDLSSVLATAPVVLGQSAYSRDFEREADDEGIVFMRLNGISPNVMSVLFDRLGASHAARDPDKTASKQGVDLGIAWASHPSDAERRQRFRDAAVR